MWFWFGFAILALIGEAMTGTFYLLLFAFGLAAGGVAALLGAELAMQIVAVAVVTLVGLYILRKTGVLKKREVDASRNKNVNLDIGQLVDVQSWSDDNTTRVWYRGAYWQARLQAGAARQAGPHRIVALQGATLLVSPENPTH
ncbi:NfeD family protein [Candidimonas humi]|jgi:membrane protein implicated in regulation of membrane protease activity|uniref:NfeD family protein n=1 Tax=Candidimonas humi TaxID=683355 RepID=A0ABV8NRV8_9BURK|nr:NfeD family protein [Candidimonas humi]MBV6303591.1 NfeD family protein [Candidimonas humi]